MTREEFSLIVKGLKAVYTDVKFIPDRDAFNVWYELLSDVDYKIMNIATQKYIMSERFAPSVADLRKLVAECSQTEELNEMQAWALVSNAVRDSLYHAQERFDALPDAVKKAVGSPQTLIAWGQDEKYNENVAQSHFISVYRTVLQRNREINALPEKLRNALNGISVKPQNLIGD